MFDTRSIVVLLKIAVVSFMVAMYAWQAYWPQVPTNAAAVLVGLSFLAGCASTSVYFLTRYRSNLTPAAEVSE